jgi:hypothetical protein
MRKWLVRGGGSGHGIIPLIGALNGCLTGEGNGRAVQCAVSGHRHSGQWTREHVGRRAATGMLGWAVWEGELVGADAIGFLMSERADEMPRWQQPMVHGTAVTTVGIGQEWAAASEGVPVG